MGSEDLVVDDEAAVRSSLLRALRFEGYEALDARDGQQALVAVRAGGIDAVVLDLMMPARGCRSSGRSRSSTAAAQRSCRALAAGRSPA